MEQNIHKQKQSISKKLISIIIPCYNEEKNVHRAFAEVKNIFDTKLTHYDFEVIFTDNHSEDNTFIELSKLAKQYSNVKVVRFSRNFGFNKSVLTGYRLASGEAAIQIDCDLQDSPDHFLFFIQDWEQGHDVVVGIREKREESVWILALRKTFYRFIAMISDDNLMIDGGDFRLIDKSILEQLRQLHDATPYVRGLVSKLAKNQTGFTYERQKRQFGKSKFPVLRLMSLAVDGITSHSTLPLRLASFTGVTIAIVTLLLAMLYFIGKIILGMDWPSGFTTQIILQLLDVSINAIFLGIIGEYLGRIHQQLKQHPIVVIKDVINLGELKK
ncbi:glycosyltransferase family 2 protein [Candidatus Venteria ishoeyi]|uniref:Putative glycosyltransferase CsbB n=1 Tax=Candidatus Venteria ishoeyi TaxID=1899563 RepID=A0A1H6F638_9GAMM|nr:glycosyltransferase family 2 protein [Candidatus Venteria ishoeyi]SEH05620.1 Putative glycosyltransferase CsbB [Candidatus Venteria ishoeyi]